jgi:AcrR family transcriptional regulator
MRPDANTVNIEDRTSPARGYHHGDLRDALIEAGMGLLERRDSERLSLREVARAVGVSATAVYRHFPDKDALMRAIAERGFMLLGAMQIQAAGDRDALEAFKAVGVAYIRFALQNPAVFRLMFSCAPPRDLFSLAREEQNEPLRLLRENVAGLAPSGLPEQARKIASISAWALVHGLAVLLLDGMVEADDSEIAAIVGSWHVPGPGVDCVLAKGKVWPS